MVEFGGRLSSLLTNYDVTLWLLLATAVEESFGLSRAPELKPCTAMPLLKVWVHPLRPEVRKTLASLNLALVGAKIEDNLLDGESKWLGYAFRPLRSAHGKALETLSELNFPVEVILGLAERQKSIENDRGSDLATLCGPTEDLLSCIFAFMATLYASETQQQQGLRELLADCGRNLGTALYCLDALSDITKDLKQGSFNAIVANFGDKINGRWTIKSVEQKKLSAELKRCLDGLEDSLAQLPLAATAPLIKGLLAHLRTSSKHHLAKLRQDFGQVAAISEKPGAWASLSRSFAWGSRQRRAKAAFVAPVTPQCADGCDACACDGCACDGCGSSGCEGCACDGCGSSGCESCACDGCGGCGSCSPCHCEEGCGALSCGESCSCAELTCECCIEPGAECCCDISCDYCGQSQLSDCCCCGIFWRDRPKAPLYNNGERDDASPEVPVREKRRWGLGKKKPPTGAIPVAPENDITELSEDPPEPGSPNS